MNWIQSRSSAVCPNTACAGGDLGAVVHMHSPEVVEVELVRASGETQALVTLAAKDVRGVGDDDLLAVRPVEPGRRGAAWR